MTDFNDPYDNRPGLDRPGLDESWSTAGVDLDVPGQRITITRLHAGRKLARP